MRFHVFRPELLRPAAQVVHLLRQAPAAYGVAETLLVCTGDGPDKDRCARRLIAHPTLMGVRRQQQAHA